MTSPKFVFHLTCLFLGMTAQTTALKLSSSVHPDGCFLSVKTGDSLTLQCFYEANVAARLQWYKQPLGQKPQLIATFYKSGKNDTFYGEFENNTRFTLDPGNSTNNLTITNLNISDSATYFCASWDSDTLDISERINVTVEDLSGDGSNLDWLKYEVDCEVLVYILSVAWAFTTILAVILACIAIKMMKRNSFRLQDSQARFSAPSTANDEGSQEADNLHYATVRFNQPDRSGQQGDTTVNECVYSNVKP